MIKDIKVEDKIITIDDKEYKESELSPTVKNNLAILGDCNNKRILASLEVNKNVDERYNLEKATEVACKYLLKSKSKLGSWTLAAAGYNAGNAGVSRRLKEQGVARYYDLLLGEETGRYLFRIVALKEILSNPKKYGFNFREKDLYTNIPTYKVEVDSAVTDFTQFAQSFGINYKILKLHNPWLREPHLNNKSKKPYYVEIPKEGYYGLN